MKLLRALASGAFAIWALAAGAQTWQPLAHQPTANAGEPLLLTDGTVLVHVPSASAWWKLTPDVNGSYQNGTWTQVASMDSSYGPLYFASAVLADGRLFVMGGEYNFGSAVWTNKGAIYNPISNTWTNLTAPWSQIGDAQCAVMPNGHLLIAHPFDTQMADFNPATLGFTLVGSGKTDRFDEEGWTLMRDGTILTVDAINAPNCERYLPTISQWINASATPQTLCDAGSQEIGPAVLMPDGTVFATGATGHNAIYHPGANLNDPGTWTAAPDFPVISNRQYDIADGPACLLPNGNVLCDASPGIFNTPSRFYEFNGVSLVPVPATPNSPNNPSYVGNMLMLPTGQVLFTDFSKDVEIYTPTGGPDNAWRPTISVCPTVLSGGTSFLIQGTQFNGLSQCSSYGDDSTNASNYPLVRVINQTNTHVKYCRTSGHSTMAVATGIQPVSTTVAVPSTIETGVSNLQVVTNGIPSASFEVNVGNVAPSLTTLAPASAVALGPGFTLTLNGAELMASDTVTWNGTDLATSKVNVGQLTATVPASGLLTAGPVSVRIRRANGGLSNVLTFTVLPVDLQPSSYNLNFGSLTSGNLSALALSDNVRLISGFSYAGSRLDPNFQIDVTATTSSTTAARIDIQVESSSNVVGPVQKVYAFDFVANGWVLLDTAANSTTDSTRTVSITSNAGRFLQAGSMRVRVEGAAAAATSRVTYSVDMVHWILYP